MKSETKINVLLVFANPLSTNRLSLDAEAREIKRSIERSLDRDTINIVTLQATTIRDFRRALIEPTPFQIIHISGHGCSTGLIFADDQGGQYIVDPTTFAEILKRYPSIQCALLNACYSSYQGQLLADFIPFTVAMEGPLTDDVAIAFAIGFYDALGAGRSIDFSYEEGLSGIKTEVSPFATLPRLLKKGEVFLNKDENNQEEEQRGISERAYVKSGKFLVGLAIDLSGSMDENIRNSTNVDMSRLRSLGQSLSGLFTSARTSIQESRNRNIETF